MFIKGNQTPCQLMSPNCQILHNMLIIACVRPVESYIHALLACGAFRHKAAQHIVIKAVM